MIPGLRAAAAAACREHRWGILSMGQMRKEEKGREKKASPTNSAFARCKLTGKLLADDRLATTVC